MYEAQSSRTTNPTATETICTHSSPACFVSSCEDNPEASTETSECIGGGEEDTETIKRAGWIFRGQDKHAGQLLVKPAETIQEWQSPSTGSIFVREYTQDAYCRYTCIREKE